MDVNVQALSEREGAAVPSRFIRTMQEQATFAPHDDFCEQIPVIDLAGLSENQQENTITMASIASASEDWGFFQVRFCVLGFCGILCTYFFPFQRV
jgi:hypothetical protein